MPFKYIQKFSGFFRKGCKFHLVQHFSGNVHQVLLWTPSSVFGNFMEHFLFQHLLVWTCHKKHIHYMMSSACFRPLEFMLSITSSVFCVLMSTVCSVFPYLVPLNQVITIRRRMATALNHFPVHGHLHKLRWHESCVCCWKVAATHNPQCVLLLPTGAQSIQEWFPLWGEWSDVARSCILFYQ